MYKKVLNCTILSGGSLWPNLLWPIPCCSMGWAAASLNLLTRLIGRFSTASTSLKNGRHMVLWARFYHFDKSGWNPLFMLYLELNLVNR